jgi:ATP-dependent Clp protease ATP-binding subunit ClpC
MKTTPRSLTIDAVYQVLSTWTGIPVTHFRAADDLDEMLSRLPVELTECIFGQDEAIDAVAKALRRALALTREPRNRRPQGVLLLVGPSGVGKTELARSLAEVFYGDAERYVKRIDMSEFTAEHTVSRLVGAPPGYVGYGRGGDLVNALKETRHGVLLLDEVEKAHPQVLTDALLPLVGEGIIHDMSTGELVDASNFLVVMTSNLGTNPHMKGGRPLGFGSAEHGREEDIRDAVTSWRPGSPPLPASKGSTWTG